MNKCASGAGLVVGERGELCGGVLIKRDCVFYMFYDVLGLSEVCWW